MYRFGLEVSTAQGRPRFIPASFHNLYRMVAVAQALLGANVFAAVQYQSMGKKSLWIGAALGTVSDVDVFLSLILCPFGAEPKPSRTDSLRPRPFG